MANDRRAILLAAGRGARLQPLTDIIPKCLMPIRGRPLLEYWLQALMQAGVSEVLINTHYKPELFNAFLADNPYTGNITFVHEEHLLGTGGTLLKNHDFLQGSPILFLHADNLCLADIEAFWQAHMNRPHHTAMTMMTFKSPTPKTCGVVDLDKQGVVQAFYEKVENPQSDLANGAVYIVEPEVVDFISELGRAEVDFSTEVLPYFIGRIYTYHNDLYHRDIGNPNSLFAAHEEPSGYPWAIPNPDSWSSLCKKYLSAELDEFPKAIALALGAQLLSYANIETAYKELACSIASPIVVMGYYKKGAVAAAEKLRDTFPLAERIILTSKYAYVDYSFYDIYRKYKVTCYPLCAYNIS